MGFRNREIEVKILAAPGSKLPGVNRLVKDFVAKTYSDHDYILGNASDLYWHTPKQSDGDFVRLRKTTGRAAQITMKATDNGDNTNRVEIDLDVEDFKQARILMTGVHGDPVESVKKKYHVYFLEDEHTTISVYKVASDERIFLEFEAKTEKRVRGLIGEFMEYWRGQYSGLVEYQWVGSSIYNMFVEKKKMISKPLTEWMEE